MEHENEKADRGPDQTLEHPGDRPDGEVQSIRQRVVRHEKSSVHADRRPGRAGDDSDNRRRHRESTRQGEIGDVLKEILLSSLREKMKNGESEDAGGRRETRLTQRGEESPSPYDLLRSSLENKSYREGLDGHEPQRPLRCGLITTGKTERMNDAGRCEFHDERSQHYPSEPEQGATIDTQAQTDMTASVERAAQDVAQNKSEDHRCPMDQQHTSPHRERLQ